MVEHIHRREAPFGGAALGNTPGPLGELAGIVLQEFWSQPGALDRIHLHAPADRDVTALGDFGFEAVVELRPVPPAP
jgi:hypothetical protein